MLDFINSFLKKIFGSKHERDIKKMEPAVEIINSIEILFLDFEAEDIGKLTSDFMKILEAGKIPEDYVEKLNDSIIEKYKKLREADDGIVEQYIERYRNIFITNRKDIEKKYDKNRMKSVILNTLSDIRIEKLLEGLRSRLTEWRSTDPKQMEFALSDNWKKYFETIDRENLLNIILPQAFALAREASTRRLGLRHFDVQMMGGITLHQGKISEMRTGEGKTLVATLAVYLNSLTGSGVHMITVNEYLAKRDSIWMGELYKYLYNFVPEEKVVGLIYNDMPHEAKGLAYDCLVTFGTNTEFGFDYLRDNMAVAAEHCVQRGHNFAIIDEVDSILIDEARTPLIISGAAEDSTELYYSINKLFPMLQLGERKEEGEEVKESGDYWIDEKGNSVALTDAGAKKCEKLLSMPDLFSIENMKIVHHIHQMLRAYNLFKKEVDYIIKDGKVVIVDEFTGRLMPGRRWSDGLHQAVEAKEGLRVENESQTMATITLQNYFRMYKKLAGMTGTADTEAQEFWEIYKLDVVVIPTNMPMVRIDHDDKIYKSKNGKYKAVVELIKENHKRGRPVLVGTISIEVSELLSTLLRREMIMHNVLNAKYHEKEAEIIASAGQKNAITIATNMAGRGTDIVLGEEVPGLGGLLVIGTERHEARRIDNQLRGRSGRQGDQGETVFYVSLDDDLMRLFGSDRIAGLMGKLGMDDTQDIQHPIISKSIERAQKKVEGHNFDIRKHLIDFDNVMNTQREIIYKERKKMLTDENLKDYFKEIIEEVVENFVLEYCPEKKERDDWDWQGLSDILYKHFQFEMSKIKNQLNQYSDQQQIYQFISDDIIKSYELKLQEIPAIHVNYFLRMLMLNTLDTNWKDHLYNLDYLKEGIHLQGWASKDPVIAYKNQSMRMFTGMILNIKETISEHFFKLRTEKVESAQKLQTASNYNITEMRHSSVSTFSGEGEGEKKSMRNSGPRKSSSSIPTPLKIGRNDDCPCGSGKKYKKCCYTGQ